MASGTYNRGKTEVMNGGVDLLADVIKIMLLDNTYVPITTENFVSEIVAKEVSGPGYVDGFGGAGRKILASKVIVEDDPNNRAEFSAATIEWAGLDVGTIDYAVLIEERTNDADSVLISWLDLQSAVSNGSTFKIIVAAQGFLQIGEP